MKIKNYIILGLVISVYGCALGYNKDRKQVESSYIHVTSETQKPEDTSRFAEWKKRWACSEYTAAGLGVTTSLLTGSAIFRIVRNMNKTALSGIEKTVGTVCYMPWAVLTSLARYPLTGNLFGDKKSSWIYKFCSNSSIWPVVGAVGVGTFVGGTLFLRSPLGYAYRAKWNLDLIESYYLSKSNELLRSISFDQKCKLEKKLAHVRRMLVLSLPGVGVTKFTDKPWLPTHNSENTAQFVQELKDRYIDYANRLISVVPHLSVEFGF